jgi:preprotein translocase subunit Sec63
VPSSSSSSSSSSCQERQLPLRRGAVAQPKAFSGGATTVRTSSSASTLYDVLGVSKSSSAKEIKVAYRQATRKLHLDVVSAKHRQDSTKDLLVMQNAYHVLSNDQSRTTYDLQLSMLQEQQHHRIPTISMESNWVSRSHLQTLTFKL